MLRNQASGIPHIVVAPKIPIGPQLPADITNAKDEDGEVDDDDDEDHIDRSIYNAGTGDARGFYEDGAYIGRDDDWNEEGSYWEDEEDNENEEASESAVREAYSEAIMHQYQQMRSILNRPPPKNAARRLPSSQATYASPFGPGSTAIKIWPPLLRNTDPSPLQVSLMSKDTVIRILRIMLGGKFLRRGYPLPERTSRWIWALLARLPERGELNYSEIGWIRDLGRRAVLLGRSLSEMAALREELAEGGLGVNDAVDASSSDEELVADEASGHADAATPEAESLQTPDSSPVKDAKPDMGACVETDAAAKDDVSEGEVDEEDDVAMDIESDSDEGEIREEGKEKTDDAANSLEAAKMGLLARLEAQASDDEEEEKLDAARERSRMNMRATLNMILTVAGEFYGQRDLLEFREPFVGM